MSAQYVRDYYGVPAKRGQRIIVDGRPGVITSFDRSGAHINVRLDGDKHPTPCHPTWRVEYL